MSTVEFDRPPSLGASELGLTENRRLRTFCTIGSVTYLSFDFVL